MAASSAGIENVCLTKSRKARSSINPFSYCRKPGAEIFEQVLEENNLLPEQTLFLDDYAVNIEGAKALGIRTIHVTSPHLILDYFHA